MDPNKAIPQESDEKITKLENDLKSITEKASEASNQEITTEPTVTIPVVEPVVPEPAVSPSPVVNKKGSPLMTLAIILAFLAVVVVVIYMFTSKVAKVVPTPTPIITVSPTVIPTEMPNASESANPFLGTPEETASASSSPSATITP